MTSWNSGWFGLDLWRVGAGSGRLGLELWRVGWKVWAGSLEGCGTMTLADRLKIVRFPHVSDGKTAQKAFVWQLDVSTSATSSVDFDSKLILFSTPGFSKKM